MTSTSSKKNTSLVFSVRGPIPIQLDETNSGSASSGASVLDLIFPQPETVSEIRFRNWYTARVTLLVRFDDSVQSAPKREHLAWAAAASLSLARLRGVDSIEGIKIGRNLTASKSLSEWTVSVPSKTLMMDPHSENGSQDIFVIDGSESLVPLQDLTALRFLLRQPSPNWKTFTVDDISVTRSPMPTSTGAGSAGSSAVTLEVSTPGGPEDSSTVLDVLQKQTKVALQVASADLKMPPAQAHFQLAPAGPARPQGTQAVPVRPPRPA